LTKILDDATAHTIANQALPFWDLPDPQITLISRSENIVFRVDAATQTQYILRIHRPGYHTLDELNAEQEWTTALNRSGLSVPVAVKTSAGQGYVPINFSDQRYYVGIVEWFEGTPLLEILEKVADPDAIAQYYHQLGQIAARIHNQSAQWEPVSSSRRHGLDADGLAGGQPFWGNFWDLPQISDAERQHLSGIRASVYSRLQELDKNAQVYSLIHADLHPGNVLINDEHLHVIDFDDCAYGWHIYELAISLFYSMDRPDFERLQHAMIAGYRTQRPLEDETVALLPFFLLIRRLSLIGWTNERPELGRSARVSKFAALACQEADALIPPI